MLGDEHFENRRSVFNTIDHTDKGAHLGEAEGGFHMNSKYTNARERKMSHKIIPGELPSLGPRFCQSGGDAGGGGGGVLLTIFLKDMLFDSVSLSIH